MARRRRPGKRKAPSSAARWWFAAVAAIVLVAIALVVQQQQASPVPPTATAVVAASATDTSMPPQTASQFTVNVKNTLPHDRGAFIQGLVYQEGIFYEGTGLYGRSSLRKVTPETGNVIQEINLAPNIFGEGITIWGDKIIQITWKSRKGFVYDKNTFERLATFSYPTEGWGITHDDTRLIMSDGTATLYFWNPETLAETGRITVTDHGVPVTQLNELEYINGEVWANVWQTNKIARINPETGTVTGWIDASGLLSAEDLTQQVDVLNGIALDAETGRVFITGKLWPKIFEIELISQ